MIGRTNAQVGAIKRKSYAILTDGRKIDFELDNTPIINFSESGSSTTINGVSISKSLYKELYFGSSYGELPNLGTYFLHSTPNLILLDLSNLTQIASIGQNFLYNCSALTQFTMGALQVPTVNTSRFLEGTVSLGAIYVPLQSVQSYKTKAPWSNHASKIVGY